MAKAEKIVVTLPVTVMRSGEAVQLTLAPEEAQFLRDLMAHVGGCSVSTRRKYADEISRALGKAGVNYNHRPPELRDNSGSVSFK